MDIVVSITPALGERLEKASETALESDKSVYIRWPLAQKPEELEKKSWVYFAWGGFVRIRFKVAGFSDKAPVTWKGESFVGNCVLLEPGGVTLSKFIPTTQFNGWRYFLLESIEVSMMVEVQTRLECHLKSVAVLEGKRQELSRQREEIQSDVDRLEDNIHILDLVSVLFDHMLSDLSKQSLEKMQSLLTAGLRVIFDDQRLSVEAEIKTEKRHPALSFILHDETRGVRAPIRGNFGGGPVAVADLLLRVLTILKLNMARVLILDEALSQVSTKYLGNAGEFLNKLCSRLGMTIVLVTHSDFGKSAARVYKAFSRRGELKLLLEGGGS